MSQRKRIVRIEPFEDLAREAAAMMREARPEWRVRVHRRAVRAEGLACEVWVIVAEDATSGS